MKISSQMRILIFCPPVLLALAFAKTTSATQIVANSCSGIWGAAAETPYIAPNLPLHDVISPNGRIAIKATGNGLYVVNGQQAVALEGVIGNPPVTEVLWSPDSKSFVINESDGGTVGTWLTHFFYLDQNGRPVSRDIESLVSTLASKMPDCASTETANIAAVAWLNQGKELLLVAEVPAHSSCRNMGAIAAFRVSIASWKMIEQLSGNTLRKQWPSVLGCRLSQSLANQLTFVALK